MASLTVTADNTIAAINLVIDFDSFTTANQVTVVRVHPDGTEYTVRGGYRIVTFPVTFDYMLTDFEAPLDTAVTYRAFEDVTGQSPTVNVITSGSVTITSGGYMWLKDPARPWANIRVDLCGSGTSPCGDTSPDISLIQLGRKTRAPDANLIPILDGELPADIWARRKGIVSSIAFATHILAAIDRVYTLFTVGGPLLFQVQPAFGWPDAYWQPGELQEDYSPLTDQRNPYRDWTVPLVQVEQPSPAMAAQGSSCANWCTVADTYATSATLTATGLTWAELMVCDTVASCVGYGLCGYGDGPYGD